MPAARAAAAADSFAVKVGTGSDDDGEPCGAPGRESGDELVVGPCDVPPERERRELLREERDEGRGSGAARVVTAAADWVGVAAAGRAGVAADIGAADEACGATGGTGGMGGAGGTTCTTGSLAWAGASPAPGARAAAACISAPRCAGGIDTGTLSAERLRTGDPTLRSFG